MTDQPNILLIITDHQAYYGHNRPGEFDYEWPRFEQFSSQGTRFERAYSVCPLCSPARASMMTGVYPSRHGLRKNTEVQLHYNRSDFRQGQQLYSHHLSRAGYRNAYVGKWHCGHEKLPIDFGIEGWSLPDYGKVYMSDAYKTYAAHRGFGDARAFIEHDQRQPEWEGTTVVLHDQSPWRFMNASGILVGPPEAHEEQFVAHLAIEKLHELARSKQPWSLVASFWGPHQPYYPSEPFASAIDPTTIPEYPSFRDDLRGRPLRRHIYRDFRHIGARKWRHWSLWQEVLARCYGQALQLDNAVGSVLDTLDELGLSKNTLVIWCADHGDAVASHGGLWDKGSTYAEEVARVPMAMRWPTRFQGGQLCDRLVSNMDVTATLLDAADVSVPDQMDSRSLLALCRDPSARDWPDHLICEHNGHGDDILQRIIVRDQYKYVAALFDGDEFYDLEQDPFELNNLIGSSLHRDIRDELRQLLVTHIEEQNDRAAHRLAYALKHGF
ncbi:MAG: sulfatase-like hydrolase/transferase [Chloroflexi bacterium]|nr:sulfatase-like hydrolase/transferase [Chloroflexota bacterium]